MANGMKLSGRTCLEGAAYDSPSGAFRPVGALCAPSFSLLVCIPATLWPAHRAEGFDEIGPVFYHAKITLWHAAFRHQIGRAVLASVMGYSRSLLKPVIAQNRRSHGAANVAQPVR